MKIIKTAVMVLALVIGLGAMQPAKAGVSFSIGTDDFYLSVGNYDYLPYAYSSYPQFAPSRINFYDVMSDYGYWVSVQPFGRVWRPYADQGWRPYVNGHWVNTRYGMTWSGYEPWAWAGYHYGNWIWTRDFGWVWIPGYDYHPGRVAWSQGYDTIGWTPAPPNGYDYSRGYLSYRGQNNQYTYNDPDFYDYGNQDYGNQYDYRNQYYGGPYYDSGYRDMYYNPAYQNINVNLWIFVGRNHFGYDNYADYYLDRDYTQNVFQRRLVRISSRPLQREQVERIVKQKIREVPVEEKELQTDRQKVKVVIPVGEEENIRKNANKTVREVIAPAFAEKHKTFKGTKSQNEHAIAKIFKQENRPPKVETVDSDQVIRKAQESHKARQVKRQEITKKEVDQVQKIEKEVNTRPESQRVRKSEQHRTPDTERDKKEPGTSLNQDRDRQFTPEKSKNMEQQKQKDLEQQKQREFDQQKQKQRDLDQQKQREFDQQKQKQKTLEQDRQREFDQQKQKQKTLEQDRQREFDQQKQKQKDLEQQKQPELDQQKQRDREQTKDTDLRKQSDKSKDAEVEKQKQQDVEKAKEKAKQKDKDKKKQPQTKPDDNPDKHDKKIRGNRS